ncbi:MAG: class I adenylate-forming enzyme family protein [Pseudomonadota bacterium]
MSHSYLLLQRLIDTALRLPDQTALICGQRTIRYTHLLLWIQQTSNFFAQLLSNPKVLPNDKTHNTPIDNIGLRIGIYLESSAEYVVATYALWQLGYCVIALPPKMTTEEWKRTAEKFHLDVLITDDKRYERWRNEIYIPVLQVPALRLSALNQYAIYLPATISFSHDLNSVALILLTSGSTGEPKGVKLTHQNLASNTAAIQQCVPIHEGDITHLVLPMQHSFGQSVLHTHLTVGATLIIDPGMVFPQRTLTAMAQAKITSFYGVPAMFVRLLQQNNIQELDWSSLRYVAQAGGAMSEETVKHVEKIWPSVKIFLMYGQTEATARITCHEYLQTKKTYGEKTSCSVGRALPNIEISIQKENHVLTYDQEGEICVRGSNVMAGYLDEPIASSEAIQQGWLHTGDWGYVDQASFLHITARIAEFFKVSGYRISAQEIERVVLSFPGVKAVAAVAIPDPIAGEVPHVCICWDLNAERPENEVLAYYRQHVELYKMPRAIHSVEEFPLTLSGKLRRGALRDWVMQKIQTHK